MLNYLKLIFRDYIVVKQKQKFTDNPAIVVDICLYPFKQFLWHFLRSKPARKRVTFAETSHLRILRYIACN